ncbi:MAG: Rab family GTPase [Gammaproteobacteria bacterium]
MTTRKICIIGDFAVGKTSTVARVVHNVFSDKYLTTVGVKIDTKSLALEDGRAMKLVIWDIAGTDRFTAVEYSYLRGASGYLLVIDGTRRQTMDVALELQREARERYGDVPCVTLVNKNDLTAQWQLTDDDLKALRANGHRVYLTSARTGEKVEEALLALSQLMR